MKVKVATSQFKALKGDFEANLNKAISLVEKASNENVDILLLQELFQDYYFCSTKNDQFFDLSIDFPSHFFEIGINSTSGDLWKELSKFKFNN